MTKQWHVRSACAADDYAIRDLLRETSQPGMLSLGFERDPSYFNAIAVSYSQPEVYVYEDLTNKRIVGMFSAGLRDVYINGKPQLVRYTGDLRIHPDHQGTRVMFRMVKKLKNILGEDSWAHSVILSDNKKSLQTVSSARGGMPQYFHQTQFLSHTLFPQRKLRQRNNPVAGQVRPANSNDTPAMQKFFDQEAPKKQFFPRYDFSKLNSNNPFYQGLEISDFYLAFDKDRLTGILGIWNQEEFKQTRVVSYKNYFSFLRYLYNTYSAVCGGIKIPKQGQCLNYCYAHTIVLADNNPDILLNLLGAANTSSPQLPIVLGLDSNDPLNKAVQSLRKHTLKSEHFLTSYGANPKEFLDAKFPYTYPEVARL